MANAIALASAPIPLSDKVVTTSDFLSTPWVDWCDQILLRLAAASVTLYSASLTGQSASIGATDVTDGTLSSGLYRVSYYFRVTTAAAVTSSIEIDISWLDGLATIAFAGAAEAGNTTSTYQSGAFPIHIDAGSPVTYATTYASNPASAMQYSLYVALEKYTL